MLVVDAVPRLAENFFRVFIVQNHINISHVMIVMKVENLWGVHVLNLVLEAGGGILESNFNTINNHYE